MPYRKCVMEWKTSRDRDVVGEEKNIPCWEYVMKKSPSKGKGLLKESGQKK